MDLTEFNKVSLCRTTKEMWDLLETIHKGANQVKEIKINILVYNYKMFKIKPDKNIKDMFIRFWDIISTLKGLEKTYPMESLLKRS